MRTVSLLLASLALGAVAAAQQPNVVLLMADDLGYGDLACQGHPDLHTPHLDALAADGIRFTRFHAAAPVCSPTRASCLTGRHPYRCDVPFANTGHLREDEVTLQKLLRTTGYRTGHFGKWHLGTLSKTVRDSNRGGPRGVAHFAPPWLRGFDVCFSTEAKVPTFDPMRHPTSGKPYGTRYWNHEGDEVRDNLDGNDSRVIMDRVLPFVHDCADDKQPFLAVVWFHAPHLPVVASKQDRARYSEHEELTQSYYGCITGLDREVGRLRTALTSLGIADDTIVWFCSDNGPEGKRGKAPGSAGTLRGRKRSLYEGGTRVPAMLSWPARIKSGLVINTLACTSDLLPTIASWLDVPLPNEHTLDGLDLGASLVDGKTTDRTRPIGFESRRTATWTDNRFKLVAHLAKVEQGLPEVERIELFDLVADSSEKRDIAEQNANRVTTMQNALASWRRAIRHRP